MYMSLILTDFLHRITFFDYSELEIGSAYSRHILIEITEENDKNLFQCNFNSTYSFLRQRW